MTTTIAEVYDAFISAGAQEDEALAGASAIADYQGDIAAVMGDVKLIKLIVGFTLAFSVTMVMLLVRLLTSAATLPF